MSHSVVIRDAVKKYGDFVALKGVSLDIESGEFFTLLGPSGCGKTTLLRMIAGFNSVEEGTISFDETVINDLAPHKRGIGMVFQNYAIFPHLTVEENVAYGLKAQKVAPEEIKKRVAAALEMVQIEKLKDRMPNELSGGQQQRVALARAFVIEPRVLLMDEPLSNLDAKLRVQMRTIIKKLQRRLGITTIYVTHDQEEALAISDRIAVMNLGEVMQVGTPEEIYKNPGNQFVSGFIGTSNFLDGRIENSVLTLKNGFRKEVSTKHSGDVILSARPEQVIFSDQGITGTIIISTFLGDFMEYEVELSDGQLIQVNEYTKDTPTLRKDGEKVFVNFDWNKIRIFESKNGEAIE
ncbi:MAG: ABC transporter ATP-binding protein [Eubacteriales bacterium]|nr:ABC transporter ATP-binding protein [Eubacteriales bacterium]